MEDHILLMDVGGTALKYAMADPDGELIPGTAGQIPSHSGEGLEEILEAFYQAVRRCRAFAPADTACVSIPGPFDYDLGISRMRHKFTALWGFPLGEWFARRGLKVRFLHDSTAFMLGEAASGALDGAENACCFMLGTGLGFAMMHGGRVLQTEDASPALSVWKLPWGNGIAEDQISSRALQRRYGAPESIRKMADAAREGNALALKAFRETGEALSVLAEQLLHAFPCERIALGGQIARAADLMALHFPCPWYVCPHPEESPLRGAARYIHLGVHACVRTLSPEEIQSLESEVHLS